MATTSPFVPDISGAAKNFFSTFNAARNRRLQQKQLEINQAIAERRISVQEGDLLLRQEQEQSAQESQQAIQENQQAQADLIRGGGQQTVPFQDQLSQQLNLAQAPQLQDPTSAAGGLIDPSLAATPTSQEQQPGRLTDATRREQDALSAELIGIKGGAAIFAQFKSVLDRGDKRELALAKEDIEDEQRFALSLSKADTREKRNKLIQDEMVKETVETGQIPPELQRMRNLSDDELEANIFTGLAQGEVLQKLVENQLIPPVVKPETRTSLAKNLELAGIDPKSVEGQKIIRESLTKPGVKIDINKGLDFKIPLGFMLLDQKDPTKGVTPIPGGPKDTLSSENAAKTQMLRTAQKAFKGVRGLVFDKDGTLNRTNLFNAKFGTPGTDGRALMNKMEFGIQAITRLETGAAMPAEEVENTRTRFMPSLLDSTEIANLKLKMYQEFIGGTLKLLDPSGRFNSARFDAELNARSKTEVAIPTQQGNRVIRFDAQGNRL